MRLSAHCGAASEIALPRFLKQTSQASAASCSLALLWIAAALRRISRIFSCAVGSSTRSEEHTSELQSLMRISYAVFCLKKKTLIYKPPPCTCHAHKYNK